MEKTDKKKFICIKSPSSKINVGDIVYLLQDNTTIYNTTTKSAVYEHSKYLTDSRYFEEYDKTIKELITVPDVVFEKSKDVTFEKSKVKAISLEGASKSIPKTIEHPSHYTSHPSGIECIEIAKYYDFCIGSAIKYLWRAGLKSEEGKSTKEKEIEDLKKAITFIQFKIDTLTKEV